MDYHLEGKFSTEEATAAVNLASQCFQYGPRDRLNTIDLVFTLSPLNTNPDVASHFMFGISKQSVALAKLDMPKDAVDMLKEAPGLEEKMQKGGQN
ncbi:Serine/threonine-protein kinase BSK1 [Bienertia sinuspersici]